MVSVWKKIFYLHATLNKSGLVPLLWPNASINFLLQHLPPPPPFTNPSGIWAFEDWFIQIPVPLGLNCIQMLYPIAELNGEIPLPNLFFHIEENSTSIPLEEINTSSSNSSAPGRPFVSNFPHPRTRQWSNAQGHLGEDVEALNWLRLYLLQNKLSLRSIFVESSSLPNQGSCHLILSVSHLSQSTSHLICDWTTF